MFNFEARLALKFQFLIVIIIANLIGRKEHRLFYLQYDVYILCAGYAVCVMYAGMCVCCVCVLCMLVCCVFCMVAACRETWSTMRK